MTYPRLCLRRPARGARGCCRHGYQSSLPALQARYAPAGFGGWEAGTVQAVRGDRAGADCRIAAEVLFDLSRRYLVEQAGEERAGAILLPGVLAGASGCGGGEGGGLLEGGGRPGSQIIAVLPGFFNAFAVAGYLPRLCCSSFLSSPSPCCLPSRRGRGRSRPRLPNRRGRWRDIGIWMRDPGW